jgi:hypothetical protein
MQRDERKPRNVELEGEGRGRGRGINEGGSEASQDACALF